MAGPQQDPPCLFDIALMIRVAGRKGPPYVPPWLTTISNSQPPIPNRWELEVGSWKLEVDTRQKENLKPNCIDRNCPAMLSR
jgi:hypothetical protein